MGDVIDIWAWRKPDREPSKRTAQPTRPAAPASHPSDNRLPALNAPLIEQYLRAHLNRFKEGMPGTVNPVFITVNTEFAGVGMPTWLRAQYPNQIILVLQNIFDNLQILASGFQVRLYFSQAGCDLSIPFAAVTRIIDQRAGLVLDRPATKGIDPWVA